MELEADIAAALGRYGIADAAVVEYIVTIVNVRGTEVSRSSGRGVLLFYFDVVDD